jgi:hypothetical protein
MSKVIDTLLTENCTIATGVANDVHETTINTVDPFIHDCSMVSPVATHTR